MAQENEINTQKVAPKSLPIKPEALSVPNKKGSDVKAAHRGSTPALGGLDSPADHTKQALKRNLPVPSKKNHDAKERLATVGKALGEGLTEGSSVEAGDSVTQSAVQGFVSGASHQLGAQVEQSRREHEPEAKEDKKAPLSRSNLENVGLVISVRDDAKFEGNNLTVWFANQSIHPDDPRAMTGPIQLGLEHPTVSNQFSLYKHGMEALRENSESFPLLDDDGNQVGTNYVTRANLGMIRRRVGRGPEQSLCTQLIPGQKTFQADPNLSTESDVLDRAFEARTTAKAAEFARRRQRMKAWAERIEEPGYPDQVKGFE